MNTRVYLSPPDMSGTEERYLVNALRSGWVAPVGPDLDAFEREIAQRCGTAHAVGVSSGTAALHLGLLALGVKAGDAVVVPTLTFAATANAVVYTGAEPVFVDSRAEDGNVDPDLVERAVADLRREGRRVGAIVPVDLFGACADYGRLVPLAEALGVPLLEDAAEALGATRDGRPAGSFGRAAALSFNGNKIMTTSGGGMIVTGDAALAARCRHLATQAREPVPHYEHADIGYNYRLSNLLAAVGRGQLSRLDEMITRRRQLRERYAKTFAGVPGVRLLGDGDPGANCWLTTIAVEPDRAGWTAAELGAHLGTHDIETRPVWKPMHAQPVFHGRRAWLTGVADRLFATGLALPSGSALREPAQERVFGAVGEFLEGR
ncbi:aminotransferase class I/II-fold pyridoxal phosphate-dependent enzyme [Dactylosporangium fulvum]|uniref:Aminotransferase class I/II-fold pyridoxal phosphate-dependent enzyme n=1 Tax=Dactylosporangium fulvum TaxID=53359 RepID=A0ABY5VZS4_9ACTN|nr:aminotransferase class I/II-fold pyridoxal phosphate-dependent enzyme [Dactylosporangium fulvum]UWP83287.1 aminotransferase class I/II-fold pyridoxal phosphate-dependent enzyme [Dactylosporangium fulvum]